MGKEVAFNGLGGFTQEEAENVFCEGLGGYRGFCHSLNEDKGFLVAPEHQIGFKASISEGRGLAFSEGWDFIVRTAVQIISLFSYKWSYSKSLA
ncbi:hypothetical protein HNY73_005471 [Argiope bruennichi]|uniref:Uncharacterized protein n=1 Tax=Argiope bruennichi TaxID=94029 RepID=A0A8T0FJ12_ARGBR|nr:hypothetical protein HNY73_005471 [Argiope bruennichi]